MNCTRCKTKAVIGLPRHNAAFCKGCFNGFVHDQVARAIKSEKMIAREDRVLVAVSGGKDSLALWDILLKLGYRADALYVDLGIGTYSEQSHAKVTKFAEAVAVSHGAVLHLHTVEQEAAQAETAPATLDLAYGKLGHGLGGKSAGVEYDEIGQAQIALYGGEQIVYRRLDRGIAA